MSRSMNETISRTRATLSFTKQGRPYVYGLIYLTLIPIYASIYFIFWPLLGAERTFQECLYFSIVTITTLGYGDITPQGTIGQLVCASEPLFGIVLIGLFLNSVASARNEVIRDMQQKRDEEAYRETHRTRLNSHFKLLTPIIARYRASVLQICQPGGTDLEEYNPDFRLNDMRDLFQPTRLRREGYLQPAINGYFQTIEILHKELCELVRNIDLRCFPEVEGHSLNLISTINGFDYSEAILSANHTMVGDRKMVDVVREMLEDYDGDYSFQSPNLVDGYLALYHQIRFVMATLTGFEIAITKEIDIDSHS